MSKRFRTCDLNQPLLLPPSLQDWLPEGHLARFVADVMDELDLTAMYAQYERRDGRGLSAYHPLLLTRLLLYGYCTGLTSSRKIEKATCDNVAFRYLAADQHPDHDTIASFRQQHLEALAGLFVQALRLCDRAGLVKLGNVAIDGSKMLANASARRSASYAKLSERERHWRQSVDELLAEAQRTDAEEDRRFGPGRSGDALPEALAQAQSRLERIRAAKAELEREAQSRLQAAAAERVPDQPGRVRRQEPAGPPARARGERERDRKRLLRAQRNAEQPQRRYNFVDPDSRVMKDNARKCFVQAYNAQIAVDAQRQIIVAAEVTQQVIDREQLVPMVRSLCAAAGARPEMVTADAGYWDTSSLRDPALAGIRVLLPPDSRPQPEGPLPAKAPRNAEAVRMRQRLASPFGMLAYSLRKVTVEPVFGQIQEARGIRRFRLRGRERVSCEWKLICATHNLLKLFRHRSALAPA